MLFAPSIRGRQLPSQLIVELSGRTDFLKMAQASPTLSGTSTPTPSINLESLDFGHPQSHHPRPFKRPHLKPRHPRRNKTLKQILQDEQKALAAAAALDTPLDTATPSSVALPRPSVRGRSGRTLRVEGLQWSDIDAPPSLLPQKKYCDITGLEGRYTDPKTKLRFYNAEVYAVIQTLPSSVDQEVSRSFEVWRLLTVLVLGVEECQCRPKMSRTFRVLGQYYCMN